MQEAAAASRGTGPMEGDSIDKAFMEFSVDMDLWTDTGTVTTMAMASGTGFHLVMMNALFSANV
jgi:hypothetical protein